MAKRKQVESENYDSVKLYFLSAIQNNRIEAMLEKPDQGAINKLNSQLQGSPDIDALNQWMDKHLSSKGRAGLWTAMRNLDYQRKKPAHKRRLKEETFKALESYAAKKKISVDDAIIQLLNAQK